MKANYNIADKEWEWYIGSLYSQLIKNLYPHHIKNVVELAPGFRHKIANALKNLNFSGALYIIDSSSDVLKYVKEKYKEYIPDAEIICINKKFEESFDDLPKNIDLFLSNHCIDDLMISEYNNEKYCIDINNEELQDNLINLWEKFGQDKASVNRIIKKIKAIFENFFKSKKIGLVVMGQYRSNLYFLGKSQVMDELAHMCLQEIKTMIDMDDSKINQLFNFYPFGEDDERYNGAYLLENTQCAGNWIVGNVK